MMRLRILMIAIAAGLAAGCVTRPLLPPDEHWSKGTEAYHAANYKMAIYHFESILKNSGARTDLAPATLYFLGEACTKLGKTGKGEEAFRRLTGKYPRSSYARLVYGRR